MFILVTSLTVLSLEVETMKDSQAEGDHGIKCKYMLAARNYLSNTTFHGIPWVLEDISKGAKVNVMLLELPNTLRQFLALLTIIYYLLQYVLF